ncbi:hypothetical protein [Cesiribacter sp. SM1]|uniref:hypothetical protein n=1 Tax=Cesiribacter sp. SM1 TaxID=2861196 RepID=UPI001CD3D0F9|nr:hypothetical protein [Cesiribacter sp. SM1]
MKLSEHKFKVFINEDCEQRFNQADLNFLTESYEPLSIKNIKTFFTIISFHPTYKTITNRYRIPDQYKHNENNNSEATSLNDFMQIKEIKSISYFDYVGEHIHSIINQEKTWEAGDFEVSDPNDVIIVSEKYKEYIMHHFSLQESDPIMLELIGLINLARIAQKYNKELWFFDGYHWQ